MELDEKLLTISGNRETVDNGSGDGVCSLEEAVTITSSTGVRDETSVRDDDATTSVGS